MNIIDQINKTQNKLDSINNKISNNINILKECRSKNDSFNNKYILINKELNNKRVDLVKTREDLYLKLRVKNINTLHCFINEITPQIMNFCSEYIELKHINKDNSLNKKLVHKIDSFLNVLRNKPEYNKYHIRSYFKDSHNTKYLNFTISWYDGRSNNYYDTEKMIFNIREYNYNFQNNTNKKSIEFYNSNDYQNMQINTFGYVKKVMKQLKKHDEKIESLLKTRNKLQSNINNFQNVYKYKHLRGVR